MLNTMGIAVVAAGLMGIVFGASIPALNSMIGLESPEPLRATVFGVGTGFGDDNAHAPGDADPLPAQLQRLGS